MIILKLTLKYSALNNKFLLAKSSNFDKKIPKKNLQNKICSIYLTCMGPKGPNSLSLKNYEIRIWKLCIYTSIWVYIIKWIP